MNLLQGIYQELQHIIDAIYSVTAIDITIVDERLNRIVATENIHCLFTSKAPENSVFHKSLQTGRQYLIRNPKQDALCRSCFNKDDCTELAELCLPIHFKGKIIGVLGMCAFNEKARENLIQNQDSYIKLEHQLGNIISTILSEKDYGELLEYRSMELATLINALSEGVLILNTDMEIVTLNRFAKEKIAVKKDPVKTIRDVLPEKGIEALEKIGFKGEIGPIKIAEKAYIINSNAIATGDDTQGYILVFSDFDKMKDSVIKSDLNRHLTTFDRIVGESELLVKAKSQAIQVAGKDVSVLLIGETGTGKEVFAKAIHTASRRRNEVFMTINSGAIPENLIESELFGYEGGAFTGATASGQMGKFEIAKDGSLFLDEIGDLPYAMQVKLLRALEEKEIMRVGGHQLIQVAPRIISATHKDLAQMVSEGTFREDLFYRLNIVPIYIPPLRERGYDIILLSKYFLKHFAQVYDKSIQGFSKECEQMLMSYHYPGNIRELRNLIEYAVLFEESDTIGVASIRAKIEPKEESEDRALAEMTKAYEKKVIKKYIDRYGTDLEGKNQVAQKLGISLATLYRKMESKE